MGHKHKKQLRLQTAGGSETEIDVIEQIATCSCLHPLSLHTSLGCSQSDCECAVERELLLVGKVKAVDEI